MSKPKLIKFDGTSEEVAPENGTDFELPQLYKLLDTDTVEVVNLADGQIMIIDEEGKLKPERVGQFNLEATKLLIRAGGMPGDYIAGNALVGPTEILK